MDLDYLVTPPHNPADAVSADLGPAKEVLHLLPLPCCARCPALPELAQLAVHVLRCGGVQPFHELKVGSCGLMIVEGSMRHAPPVDGLWVLRTLSAAQPCLSCCA